MTDLRARIARILRNRCTLCQGLRVIEQPGADGWWPRECKRCSGTGLRAEALDAILAIIEQARREERAECAALVRRAVRWYAVELRRGPGWGDASEEFLLGQTSAAGEILAAIQPPERQGEKG